MSCPLYPPSSGVFYPLGNTPAVSLTQHLSPEQPADILLLGCGDPRNILYTLYSDVTVSSRPRKLDITCCDIEPAVLARNILLFTLVEKQEPIDRVWDIFYHFRIDDQGMELLTRQSQRLYDDARTVETWRQSSYGSFLKFLDTRTLRELRRHWSNYAEFPNLPASRLDRLRREQARLSQYIVDNKPPNAGPCSSAGMFWLAAAIPLAGLYRHYWKTGTTSMLPSDIETAKNLNPTFVYSLSGETFSPYEATFPEGFHMAHAFASITSDPMAPQASGKTPSPADIYKRQFKAWCDAFRASRSVDCVTIRFYAGDAVSFCHALDIYACTGSAPTHMFTSSWCADSINLDELAASVPPPNLKYDIIETSNIMDHLGFLNLLLITRPLLKDNPASQSVLYTEQFLYSDNDGTQPFSERICATIPTVSSLLGVAPLAWVSGFTSHSTVHEALADFALCHERIAWVDPVRGDHHANSDRPVVSFDADDLARILFGVYERIFIYEQDVSRLPRNMSAGRLRSMARIHYHRETVASLFQLVRRRVHLKTGTWGVVVEKFLDSVRRDQSRKIGIEYYQELCTQLHLYGVHTVDSLKSDPHNLVNQAPLGVSTDQSNSILCVAFTIPRERLQVLLQYDPTATGRATPMLQCNLATEDRRPNAFSSIQAIWGKLVTNLGDKASIEADPQGTNGESDLVVLFWAPADIVSRGSSLALGFKRTPLVIPAYRDILGPELELFGARLDDEKYIQRFPYRPAIITSENPPTARHPVFQFSTPSLAESPTAVQAVTGQKNDSSSVVSLTARVEITSPAEQQTLLDGASVSATQISPCTMKLSVANHDHIVLYSYPILGIRHQLRVARKSHYVEIIVPISEPLDAGGYSLNRTPILRYTKYSPWNLHHIHPDRMPLLNAKDPKNFPWINNHTVLQHSDRERAIMSNRGDTKDATSKLFAAIKDTIHSLPNHYAGTWGKRDSLFGLCETSGKVHTVLFVGGLRLDLASFTIVVDAAIIPLPSKTEKKLLPLLQKLEQANPVKRLSAMGDEPAAWRKLFPAFIERSRTWSHKANCEYDSKGNIPISVRPDESPICSCGQGIGFDGAEWKVPAWKFLLPFATRASISPLFFVPYIEDASKLIEDLQRGMEGPTDAEMASRLELTNRCWGCGGPGRPNLLVCSKCKRARYCSTICQRQDWKAHKQNCKTPY
ncbi:hypothetical protein FRC08_016462 [Ceratobasidium sp. 394]|nr:hypothetical protein FRC08_016462 [Ceratobasidium sp. 394]